MTQRVVIVSDSGDSWPLNGDDDAGEMKLLPKLLADGWRCLSVTPGSGAKDEASYWLVVLER